MSAQLTAGEDPSAQHREGTAVLGMILFVASWAMLFAALFFAYAVTRARAIAWPPADLPALPLGPPSVATVALAVSSWSLARLRRAQASTSQAHTALGIALLGAVAFLVVQVLTWRALAAAGLRLDAGSYASVFYGLTAFHALHVAVGIVGLGAVAMAAVLGRRSPRAIPVRLWTIYFHMVGVLWLLIYFGVYCL